MAPRYGSIGVHDTPFACAGGGGGAGLGGAAFGGAGFAGTGFFADAAFRGAGFFAGAAFGGTGFFADAATGGAAFAGAAFAGSGLWAVCTGVPRFSWPRWMGAGAANIQLDTTSQAAEKHNLNKADFCMTPLVSHNPRHETSRNYLERPSAISRKTGFATFSPVYAGRGASKDTATTYAGLSAGQTPAQDAM